MVREIDFLCPNQIIAFVKKKKKKKKKKKSLALSLKRADNFSNTTVLLTGKKDQTGVIQCKLHFNGLGGGDFSVDK